MIYIILIISFLLDGLFLSNIGSNSILFPLCTLMSLIIVYPFFKKYEYDKFLIICASLGILYDLVYTNYIFLNIGLFILIGLVITMIFKFFPNSLISNILSSIIIILIYRIINYIVLLLSGYLSFSLLELVKGIYSSLIVNLSYTTIFYLIGLLVSSKFKIKRFS